MAKKELEAGVKFNTLGIGSKIEDDRLELDARGAMQITRYRIDIRTQYYDRQTGEGGILKFDGFDIATGERVKYRTTSRVIISNFNAMKDKIGAKTDTDEDGDEWFILLKPVIVEGFEKVKSAIKGRNPYIKIIG